MILRRLAFTAVLCAAAALVVPPLIAPLQAQALLGPPKLTPAQKELDAALRPLRDTVILTRVALLRLQQDANSGRASDQLLGSHARSVVGFCAAAARRWPASHEAVQKATLPEENETARRTMLRESDALQGVLRRCEREFGTRDNQLGPAVRHDGAKRAEVLLGELQRFNTAAARFADAAGYKLLPTPPAPARREPTRTR